MAETLTFHFDLASPWAYLAAERMTGLFGGAVDWRGVLARELPAPESFEGFRCAEELAIFQAEVERRAQAQGLLAVRWPEPFPFDSERAMRVATYARSIGRATAFAQAAFRQAFAGGRNLAEPDWIAVAAAACEMHPAAVLKAAALRSVTEELARHTAEAAAAGVGDVPAVRLGERAWVGEDAPERAWEALQRDARGR